MGIRTRSSPGLLPLRRASRRSITTGKNTVRRFSPARHRRQPGRRVLPSIRTATTLRPPTRTDMKRRDFLSTSAALAVANGLGIPRFARAGELADVPAVSRTGGSIVLRAAEIDEFRAHQRGPVLTRTSEG